MAYKNPSGSYPADQFVSKFKDTDLAERGDYLSTY